MTIIQSIILGIVQGLSEFLPISSSAHLVIVPFLLKWKLDSQTIFIFDVLVQVATLVAVIIFFWKDLIGITKSFISGIKTKKPFVEPQSRLGWLLIIGTIPAGITGLLLKDVVEKAFQSALFTGIALMINAVILMVAERIGKRQKNLEEISFKDGILIGLAQAVSIFPGISRSGSTIAGGMTRHLNRESAARFSFLLSIPILLAAGLFSGIDMIRTPGSLNLFWIFLPGFIAATITGYLAIRWFLKFLVRRTLYDFAIYCWIFGLIIILVYFLRK